MSLSLQNDKIMNILIFLEHAVENVTEYEWLIIMLIAPHLQSW